MKNVEVRERAANACSCLLICTMWWIHVCPTTTKKLRDTIFTWLLVHLFYPPPPPPHHRTVPHEAHKLDFNFGLLFCFIDPPLGDTPPLIIRSSLHSGHLLWQVTHLPRSSSKFESWGELSIFWGLKFIPPLKNIASLHSCALISLRYTQSHWTKWWKPPNPRNPHQSNPPNLIKVNHLTYYSAIFGTSRPIHGQSPQTDTINATPCSSSTLLISQLFTVH